MRDSSRSRSIRPEAKVAGPALFVWPRLGPPSDVLTGFFQEFSREGAALADVVTWHYYPQQSRRCPAATRRATKEALLEPKALDEAGVWASYVEAWTGAQGAQPEVWLGETGNAQCGGEPGVSDRFVGLLWWLDQLGMMAARGQRVVVRQTLTGADYGLLDAKTLAPTPDYFGSLLWKRWMGPRVLSATVGSTDRFVRAYAHCLPNTPGGASLLLLNLHPTRAAKIRVPALPASGAELYRLDAPALESRHVELNGAPARLDGATVVASPLPWQGADALDLAPSSAAFVVLPAAEATACDPVGP